MNVYKVDNLKNEKRKVKNVKQQCKIQNRFKLKNVLNFKL
jgi:hypothetical protein